MSLQHAAKHLESKGRHGDDTLVHMSRNEVKSLQALAKAHGGSLTINPETGLAEAGFLSRILPMAAGAVLVSQGIDPATAGMIVGGTTTAATGSVNQGISAGLGAYGGASLSQGMTFGGGTELAPEAAAETAKQTATETAKNTALQESQNAGLNELSVHAGEGVGSQTTQLLEPQIPPVTTTPPVVTPPPTSPYAPPTNAPPTNTEIFKANLLAKPLAGAAAVSSLSGMFEPKEQTAPAPTGEHGQIMEYDYERKLNPEGTKYISQEYKPRGYRQYADGGDVQYPYSEPVVRMNGGGDTALNPQYANMLPQDAKRLISKQGDETYSAGGEAGKQRALVSALERNSPVGAMQDMALGAAGALGQQMRGQGGNEPTSPDYSYDQGSQTYKRLATGGISDAHYNLGGYSDGGRLLKGPGDGVSDSIPAVIGRRQPARLADGEFVVPARIVSEIGNGSTEAGARKLYAMMDRVQKARSKTVGKGKVAKNTRADKYLPA